MNNFIPLFTLIIGIIIGGAFFSKSPLEKASLVSLKSEENQSLTELQEKLQRLHDVDIQEYLALREQKAQFIKANEILGKMMTIFLADLGLRVNSSEIQKIKNLAQATLGQAAETCSLPEEELSSPAQVSSAELDITDKDRDVAKEFIKKQNQWKEKEKNIDNVSTDAEIEDFLKEVEIKDFIDAVSGSRVVNNKQLQKLNGKYEGVLVYSDKNNPPADVKIELDAINQDGKVAGKSRVVLSRNGQPFSNSDSDGSNLEDYKVTGGSQAIFLQIGGRTGYFQLYPVRGGSMYVGNYYRPKSLTKFPIEGRVTLYRR